MIDFKKAYEEAGFNTGDIKVLTDCSFDPAAYNTARQIFNRRLQFRPWAIVYPKTSEDVANLVRFAIEFDCEIRVRGGGHDHEGECMATDALVLDMRHMNEAVVDHKAGIARIQPGCIFKNLIRVLNENKVGIPHGTCQTVGITGFTLGGGWGPWTRKHGMCCESLVGATIVLGDGSIKTLSEQGISKDKELLWALRGGGGFSYGIVTELVIKTFPLPETTYKFAATWYMKPALQVLEGWEKAIAPTQSPNLLGTNLQIFAKPADDTPIEKSAHDCTFFGYYAGTKEEIEEEVKSWFPNLPPDRLEFFSDEGVDHHLQFSSWEITSHHRRMAIKSGRPLLKEIPLEDDIPAPHKITSRLVNAEGLGDEGRKNLIRSLESGLLFDKGEALGVRAYVTLGAISGPFYNSYKPKEYPSGSSFPYKDRPYTIQYQVWWDTDASITPEESEKAGVDIYTNRAMDWIKACRKAEFPQTSGAFISFKDDGIPTENYFMQSYEKLIEIKEKYSRDPQNRFRSRKTIV